MEDFARELILEHSRHPHNYGRLDAPSASHEEYNPLCGDRVRIDLLVENGAVADVCFSGKGCAISQAAASLLTDAVKGLSVEEATAFGKDELLELIGLPLGQNPVRLRCALLSLEALRGGLRELQIGR